MRHSMSAPRSPRVSVYDPGADAPADACLAIVRALPDYFTASTIPQLRHDLAAHIVYVIADVDEGGAGQPEMVTGFAVVERRNAAVAEILWLAVHPARQGQGRGSSLLAAIVERLRASGAALLEVKTLAPEAAYAPYEGTRRFYERAGFMHLDTIDPYPGWEPGNPCALYVKILRAEA